MMRSFDLIRWDLAYYAEYKNPIQMNPEFCILNLHSAGPQFMSLLGT